MLRVVVGRAVRAGVGAPGGARFAWAATAPLSTDASDSHQRVRWDDGHVAHSTFPALDNSEPAELRFTEFIMRDFAKRGDVLAIADGTTGETRSFADLIRDVQSVGRGLQREHGVGLGSTVAMYTPNHVDFFSALHASAKLGARITPVNPAYTAEEVARQLESASVDLVIAHADTLERAREAAAAAPGRPAVICVDAEIGAFRGEPAGDPLPSTPLGAQDTMYLPYSSGTTGLPKGVELSHANLVYNMLQGHSIEGAFYKEDCVTLSPLPLFHIYGFLASLHFPLVYGLPLITMKRYDIELFCALVEKHKVTRIHVVPPILLHLSKHPAVAEHDVSSLEMAISAAAPLRPALEALAKERLQCKVKQLWGMSELSPLGTGTPDDGIKDGVGSVGPPCADTSVKIIDVTTHEPLPQGEEGELCVRGPQVMKGYLNEPAKTADTMTADGFLRTGDIAKIDEHGYVYITDRLKELIKVKGFPVAPAELEGVLTSHPKVVDACVIPVEDEESGELPRAYVVLHPGDDTTTPQEIAAYVAEHVAAYKRLKGGVVITDAIAKTESGKLLRRKMIELDRATKPAK